MDTPPKRRKRSWKESIVIGALLSLVMVGIVRIYDALGQAQVTRAIKEAELLGGPVTLEQMMAARKTYPDEKNGAKVILSIKDRLDTIHESKSFDNLPVCCSCDDLALGHRWTADSDQQVHKFLDSVQKELATINTLEQYEGGRFPLTFEPNPIFTMPPHREALRTAQKLTNLQILDRAMHGDTTRLINDVKIMLLIGDLVDDEPNLFSMLLNISCGAFTVNLVETVCALAPVTSEQLADLQNMMGTLDAGSRKIAWGIRSERAAYIGSADYQKAEFRWAWRGLVSRDEAKNIRRYNRLVAATEASRGLQESLEFANNTPELSIFSLTSILISSNHRAFVLDAMLNAKARSAQVAMAAERYRIDSGSFPASLDQLVPKYIEIIPVDPFKPDQPLKYVIMPDRVIVYSVGEDGNDNGGNVICKGNCDDGKHDDGFILLTPAARNQPPLPVTTTSAPGK